MVYDITLEAKLQKWFNIVSLCAACISVTLILSLVCLKYRILNRMTLRFQVLIALLDIVRHVSYMNFENPDGPMCILVAFSVYFEDHLYIFLNVMIAFNVQLLYIHNIRPKKYFEIFYLICSFGLALLIDIIPIFIDAYGKNVQKFCVLNDKHPNHAIHKLFLVYLTTTPGVLYCLLSFLVTSCFLIFRSSEFQRRWPNRKIVIYGETVDSQVFIKQLFFRMSLYPVSCFVGMFPYLLANFLYDRYGLTHQSIYIIARLGRRAVGLMNLISLLYDPHFQLALTSMWNQRPKSKFDRPSPSAIALQSPEVVVDSHKNVHGETARFPREESRHIYQFIRRC